MVEPPLTAGVCIVWTAEPWQCQLWGSPETGYIVLVRGAEIVLRRPTRGLSDLRDTAAVWLGRFSGELGRMGLAEPSRRQLNDRRKTPRGGRRQADR